MTTRTKTKNSLTAKQEAFCAFYFTSRNATQSAIKAGYSPHLIDTHSNSLLENASIKAKLAEMQTHVAPSIDASVANVRERLQLLTRIARHEIELPVSAGHVTQAVAEVNKMEHVYEAGGNIRDINVVFVIGKGYSELPLPAGKLIEQESAKDAEQL